MDTIVNYFQGLGFDFKNLVITCGILIVGMLLAGALGRFVFGKRSILSCAVSSAIGILFIYALTVVLNCAGAKFEALVAPLPFITIEETTMYFYAFQGDYTFICSELLSMVILSFLVNLADGWLPRGKNLFSWVFFRALTVVIGYALHLLVLFLFTKYLPQGLVTYAPTILLGLLILLILTGALKLLVGVILASVNPFIAGMYTFFFANAIGKQITKAVLTTAILAALVVLLNYLGIFAINIAHSALMAYIPFVLILIGLWYLANKIF